MKKILIFIALFLYVGLFVHADNQIDVKLNDDNTEKIIEFINCNLCVSKAGIDNNGNTKINIEIENRDKTNVVILFGRSYPENELKKQTPSIRFDKKSYGKSNRNIETIKEGREVIIIEPTEKKTLQGILVEKNKKYSCILPFYVAKYKQKNFWTGSNGSNKLMISRKEILELVIEVELKPDLDYERLVRECRELKDEIEKLTFCPDNNHKPSLEEQESPYRNKIANIVSEIDLIVNKNLDKWYNNYQDKKIKEYDSLKQSLNSIIFNEVDCGKHKNPPRKHTCQYCTYSAELLFRELDNIYIKIDNCNNQKDQKKMRDKEMQNINLMFKCPVLSKKINDSKNKNWKSKIIDRYDRINNF